MTGQNAEEHFRSERTFATPTCGVYNGAISLFG